MEGKKFSSSRGVVIYVRDFLERYDPDALRYFIAVAGPETQDTDFTWSEFLRRNNDELVAGWGNLVNRTVSMIAKNVGEIPPPGELTDADRGLGGQQVDYPQFVQVFRRVQITAEYQTLGPCRPHSPGQECVGAHAGEQIEQDLGKAHECTAFGDDDIAGKGGFESAPLRIALQQCNAGDRKIQICAKTVGVVDAGDGIFAQRLPVSALIELHEQTEISPQTEGVAQHGGE